MQKNGPFYLISGLLLILFFIIGVRYGQRVEKTNKKISVILSTTPKPIKYELKKYKNEKCNLEFSYPSNLKINKQTTTSAEFKNKKNIVLDFSCDATTGSKIKINPFQE